MVIEARPSGLRVAGERATGGPEDGGAGRDELLRAAFAAIRDLVIILGPVRDAAGTIVDERIEFTNPAWRASLMGDANAPDPSGRMLLDAFPGLGARLPTHLQVLESGEASRETVRLPDLTGDRWWDVEYVRLDDRLLVVSREVTGRVEAEAAHRASEERYRTLVGELDGVVVVRDLANGTTFCSGQVQRLLGFPPETMVLPGAWLSLVLEEDVERVEATREGGDGRDGCELEYRMRRADGTVIWVAERWRSIRDAEGRLVRWSSVTTDVTSRKRLEETVTRTDRLEAVSRVAAAAAHDFGEVLTAIQYAQANLVAGLRGDDPRAEDVRLIGDSVRHGVQLTRQLLAFSRDRDELEPAPIDVAWLLADLEQILRGVAGTASLGIRVNASGLTRIVRSALEQAVLNLVINARDALPTGGSIRITLDRQQVAADAGLGVPAGPYLVLAVADTGSGMPVEVAERAFEPFFTTKPHGSGLGLPMVYGTMRSIGGAVRIASHAGEGTTVSLLMPEAEPAAQVAPIG